MELHPIAFIQTPFTQKFGIPRQSHLALNIEGTINFQPEYCNPDYLRGIEQFTHLWLTFGFHQHFNQASSPLVRPPRLGGNKKVGVFASRSSFRPNPIGLSLVRNKKVKVTGGQLQLVVADIDMLNGTPIFDIKPYIPYSDNATQANAGYAEQIPKASLTVTFSNEADSHLKAWQSQYPDLKHLLITMLSLDPRPAYKKTATDEKTYALCVYDLDVEWRVIDDRVLITQIMPIE